MNDLAITVDGHEFPTRVLVTGALDLEGGDELEAAIRPLVQPGVRIEVACDRIDFVDSSGVAALVSMAQLLAEVGGHLVLCDPSAPLLSVLDLTRTRELFTIDGAAPLTQPAWQS
jgi:anti-sigma B factor antagonist